MGKEAESMGRKWDEKRGEREEKIPLQREADRTTQGSEHQQQQTYRPPKADREENEERGGKRGNGIREKENGASMGSHGARDTKGVNEKGNVGWRNGHSQTGGWMWGPGHTEKGRNS